MYKTSTPNTHTVTHPLAYSGQKKIDMYIYMHIHIYVDTHIRCVYKLHNYAARHDHLAKKTTKIVYNFIKIVCGLLLLLCLLLARLHKSPDIRGIFLHFRSV